MSRVVVIEQSILVNARSPNDRNQFASGTDDEPGHEQPRPGRKDAANFVPIQLATRSYSDTAYSTCYLPRVYSQEEYTLEILKLSESRIVRIITSMWVGLGTAGREWGYRV